MLLGYSMWGMQGMPVLDAIARCARIGYDSVELTAAAVEAASASDRRRIREVYDENGIVLSGMIANSPVLTGDETVWAQSLRRMGRYMDLAADLQRDGERLPVSCFSDGAPGSWAQERDRAVERFGQFAAMAADRGVVLAVEPAAMFSLRTPQDTLWLVERIASPACAVALDISHFNVQGYDIDIVVELLVEHTVCCHVKDERGLYPNFEFLLPGEGAMDYRRFLRALDRGGYEETVAVEVSLTVQQRLGFDARATAQASYDVLATAFKDAGIVRPESSR